MSRWNNSLIVDASVEKAYRYWSSPRKVPDFVSGIEKASTSDRSGDRWRVQDVYGGFSELEIREAASGRGISWRTVGDPCGGEVFVVFEELWPERTRIHIEDSHSMPECAIVKDRDLERFRNVVENEEVLALERAGGRVRRVLISAAVGSLLTLGACALVIALRRMRGAGCV